MSYFVEILSHYLQIEVSNVRSRGPISNGFLVHNRNYFVLFKRHFSIVSRIWFNSSNLTLWSKLFRYKKTARYKTTASNSGKKMIKITNFIYKFESRSSLASNYFFVIERRYISHLSFFNLLLDHLIQVIFESIEEHYFCTIASNCCLFNLWGI